MSPYARQAQPVAAWHQMESAFLEPLIKQTIKDS